MHSVKHTCYLVILTVAVGTLAGCWGSSVESRVAALNDSNIKRMSNLYSAYQRQNGYLGPKDLAAIKEFVKQMPPRRLEMMQIKPEEFEKLTISDRDGKPFKIRFSLQGSPMGGPPMPVVFEEVGVGGTRQVGFTDSTVQEADEAKYKDLWGEKPSAAAPSDSGVDSAAKGKG
jgi:hypothetical protein